MSAVEKRNVWIDIHPTPLTPPNNHIPNHRHLLLPLLHAPIRRHHQRQRQLTLIQQRVTRRDRVQRASLVREVRVRVWGRREDGGGGREVDGWRWEEERGGVGRCGLKV